MGRDKALLEFRGRPMVEIALAKLRSFCSEVSIAGNREDLSQFAPIAYEARHGVGPVAGVEAGLRACREPWALFMPVDVPLVPAAFLRLWTHAVLSKSASGCGCSFLTVAHTEQPAFCLLGKEALPVVAEAVQSGERRLRNLFRALEQAEDGTWLWVCDVEQEADALLHREDLHLQVENWFRNINTPEDLLEAEAGLGPE